MTIMFVILICADVCWHIWEYKERKRLDECWVDLFNAKLESDQRWNRLLSDILRKGEPNDK